MATSGELISESFERKTSAFNVVNNHALKSRYAFCLHIFAGYYIRRVCVNLSHCILHLIDNTINSDGHRRIFTD
jgi:hypothetical protein